MSGDLANAAAAMIVQGDGHRGLMSFAQYEFLFPESRRHRRLSSDEVFQKGQLMPVRRLFMNFSPTKKRALWRVLLAQVLIYRALYSLRSEVGGQFDPTQFTRPVSEAFLKRFNWVSDSAGPADQAMGLDIIAEEFRAAGDFLAARLSASEFDG